jgi:hypothetical protein
MKDYQTEKNLSVPIKKLKMSFGACSRLIATLILINLINLKLNAQPIISSFSPESGPIGTYVTINGLNFNPTLSNNIVFFGAVKATVHSTTSTSLTVSVPTGATYQNISVTDLSTNLTGYSTQNFNVTFPFCGVFDTSSYSHCLDIPFEKYSFKVSVCDFDGDGWSDILLTKFGGSISVYRNTSSIDNISFDTKTDFLSAEYPVDITINDFDGDGKQDFIIAHQYEHQISINKNTSTNGIINFAPKINVTVDDQPRNVTSGDIDGDGKPDLIVTYWYVGTTSILLNTSSVDNISFAESININDSDAGYVTIFDFDGDKKLDIAKTKILENRVSVYSNSSTTGEVSFDFIGNFSTGKNPWNILTSDLNDDGLYEIITVNQGYPYSLSILKNTSTLNNISFETKIDYNSEGFLSDAFSTDIDGNGKPDIALCNSSDNFISVLLNTSINENITFAPKVDINTSPGPNTISIADFDDDGKPDMVNCYHDAPYKISVYRNNAQPHAPDICMVTVDSSSTNNLIYWDKTQYNTFDSMIIYRETISNVYKRIGSVEFDAPNFFVDTVRKLYFPYTGDPNMGSYRYKLQVRDTCGVYSNLGPYHNSIFITHNGSLFSWNHYEIEGQAIPIPQLDAYQLYRDNYADGNWTLVGGVSGSQLSINDPEYNFYPKALSRIETQWSINCSDQRSSNKSSSNIIGIPALGIYDNDGINSDGVDIFPNPFSTETTIKSKEKLDNATLTIFNIYGQQIKQIKDIYGFQIIFHRNNLASGLYFMQLNQKEKLIVKKKFLIQD